MSKIYILKKSAPRYGVKAEYFKTSACVPVDIDEAWHDWSHKWIDCSGEIVKPFSEYLQEMITHE